MTTGYFFSVAGMFLIPLLGVLIPVFLGQWYAVYHTKRSIEIHQGAVGIVVSASLGLLAFILAFTFQIAANRYTERKELLIQEVTNIRTTYLRAGLVPEPFRSGTRNYLKEYVNLRIELAKDLSRLESARTRSEQLLDTFWNYAEQLSEQDRSSESYSLYMSSVNDVIDNYNQRITASVEYRIPTSVLWILVIITFLSMISVGYQIGMSGRRNLKISVLLAMTFAIVMFLILALDRPELGLTKLNQKPMQTLQKQLERK